MWTGSRVLNKKKDTSGLKELLNGECLWAKMCFIYVIESLSHSDDNQR